MNTDPNTTNMNEKLSVNVLGARLLLLEEEIDEKYPDLKEYRTVLVEAALALKEHRKDKEMYERLSIDLRTAIQKQRREIEELQRQPSRI